MDRQELIRTIQKYKQWCLDDRIRGKYSNPRKVRDNILEDVRRVLGKVATPQNGEQ